jgi:predicted dehydrogenase
MKCKSSIRVDLSRREFLKWSIAAASIQFVPRHVLGGAGRTPPSEKMNVACIGVGGMMGETDVNGVSGENVYALCDVDSVFLDKAAGNHPKAKKYRDFREMLDKEHKNLHGVTVTIPDHMHATAAIWAMERGLGVYCQKPLTQTVWEARLMAKVAKKYNVPTQMGNQGYSCEATRMACEMIWRGDIGEISDVYATSGGGFARGITEWPAAEPVPATLNWDLWTGRAAAHPYSSKIAPINWRGFQAYGTQMIGDWGVHICGPANWALQLGSPESVECDYVEGVNPVTYPHYSVKIRFPARPNKYVPSGRMPAVTVHWYEGDAVKQFTPPQGLTPADVNSFNEIFAGSKGFIGTSDRGESVRRTPETAMKDFIKPAKVLARSPGHYQDWIRACKGGPKCCSDFSIAGPYVEWLLLGTIAWRFPHEKLLWDGPNLRFKNNQKANQYIKPQFRKGWELRDVRV